MNHQHIQGRAGEPSPGAPPGRTQADTLETSAYLFALAGRGALGVIELIHAVEHLNAENQIHGSIALYRLWLENTLSPLSHAIYYHLGGALESVGDEAGAERAYREALARKPDFEQARTKLAALLERLGHGGKAGAV
ncbi:Tetratricopeptide repeat-containing protein [Methylomagnum ishizawai]|uniref:Tetratricopeptide repeat-containing protein n=1 Tax=Methylomagnum ishizawai TaxID=1760988 RepID=A0A1Y6D328_9GAMM|nr:tetratricopeptide repeat protein [Methylomagnum ishizawai]SMF96996.1 Tetratricopeptide repeat-containing protein [Methylomagnum ishizawai]